MVRSLLEARSGSCLRGAPTGSQTSPGMGCHVDEVVVDQFEIGCEGPELLVVGWVDSTIMG
jgi:hypothetical protein